MFVMMEILAVAVGGTFGALLRYAVCAWLSKAAGDGFPWGTLAVNLIGAAILGFIYGFIEKGHIPHHVKLMLTTGLLGAFTTFSTFMVEASNMMRGGHSRMAAIYIAVSVVAGLVLAFSAFKFSEKTIPLIEKKLNWVHD